ncbi:hypothetical protein [Clostridium algidicarnis]|mgnify:CR=1 FL=1|uniref:hypothetical protein n=1 Tax=Clostridium algidicarnis TaxID=37659 RepID=UPI003FD83EAB
MVRLYRAKDEYEELLQLPKVVKAPEEQIECILEIEDSLCPYCATDMKPIGKNIIRTERVNLFRRPLK